MSGTIALVDDDGDVREVLELLLESAGYTVCLYASGRELLAEADFGHIDCVIIDQNMPGLTGTDVLLEIERRRYSVPSILITGAVDGKSATAAERLGAMTIIRKPMNADELLSFVEAAVG